MKEPKFKVGQVVAIKRTRVKPPYPEAYGRICRIDSKKLTVLFHDCDRIIYSATGLRPLTQRERGK
jgi:hypothetical protein